MTSVIAEPVIETHEAKRRVNPDTDTVSRAELAQVDRFIVIPCLTGIGEYDALDHVVDVEPILDVGDELLIPAHLTEMVAANGVGTANAEGFGIRQFAACESAR